MAYIGNNPDAIQTTIEITRFNGTGACTEFQIPQDVDDAKAIEVLVNSVQQDPDNSYTVTDGLITFSEAPSVGTNNVTVLRRTGLTYTRTQIDASDILPNAVTTAAIADGSITSAKIADGTVIAADIADGSVTGPKLGLTAINANNIVDGTITDAKIDTVANTKISGNIVSSQIADGSVTGPKLGLTAINANNIVDGTITDAKIDTVANTKISGNIVSSQLANNLTVNASSIISSANIDFKVGASQNTAAKIDSNENLQFNSGYGSVATAYGCRAWVNFNATGTPSIRASGNVSSITDGGTGRFTINFTNAMPDANYVISGVVSKEGDRDVFVLNGKPNNASSAFISSNDASGGTLSSSLTGDFEFTLVSIHR